MSRWNSNKTHSPCLSRATAARVCPKSRHRLMRAKSARRTKENSVNGFWKIYVDISHFSCQEHSGKQGRKTTPVYPGCRSEAVQLKQTQGGAFCHYRQAALLRISPTATRWQCTKGQTYTVTAYTCLGFQLKDANRVSESIEWKIICNL